MAEKVEGVRRATGRNGQEWFEVLDEWGAGGRAYRDIADYLTREHGLSKWWAQKLIVEYEQDRGLRAPGLRRDGTFEVSTSKTMAVPVERLFEAFVDPGERKRWLPTGSMRLETSEPPRSARFGWDDGTTRVRVDFADKGSDRSWVSVAHQRLTEADEALRTKTMWKERLVELKAMLEARS